ncbi:MAG TPA: sugar-transfer associated ATP-grasp domain-containing protein [Candidatus Limiplasma sp.]|nr:sugar-transfer associated ATP-grasp domain-containing protein [Candidatus Limiplasma sp.]
MSKLTFFIKRAVRIDRKRMHKTMDYLVNKSGKSRAWLLADMTRCALLYNAGYMDYKIAEMYRLTDAQKKTVITRGLSNTIVRRMNDKAYWYIFDDKTTFNTTFAEDIKRNWIKFTPDTSLETLMAFLQANPDIIAKPLEGSSGVGITHYTAQDFEGCEETFRQELIQREIGILEERVIQHDRMMDMCPTSVNTIRIATLLGDKKQGVVYAFLRIGNGKVMDNVDCGGMAARVDLQSGKLLTVGADKAGNTYETHPITGTKIIGFEVPYFKEAMDMCLRAAQKVPQMRFIAWDVAVTNSGPCFIEGNSFPSHAVPQFAAHYPDGIGIMREFREFLEI